MTARGYRARRRTAFWEHPAWRHVAFVLGAVEILTVGGIAFLAAVTR